MWDLHPEDLVRRQRSRPPADANVYRAASLRGLLSLSSHSHPYGVTAGGPHEPRAGPVARAEAAARRDG